MTKNLLKNIIKKKKNTIIKIVLSSRYICHLEFQSIVELGTYTYKICIDI